MKRKFAALFAALVMLAACGAPNGAGTLTTQSTTTAASSQGQTEQPEGLFSLFAAETLEGETVDQSIFEGKTLTMINIWATFCSPCLDEMPDLAALNEAYADKGVQVVGIVIDMLNEDGTISEAQLENAKGIVAETGANYTHLLPSYDLIALKLQEVDSVPTTIFVDETGAQVGEDYIGARSQEKWSEIIDTLLEEVAE
ncbi:MAG: hypothetical protein ABT00_15155 [Bordetella sp. SCN 68-11]|nr:MAG: hypothetical protein ABT00_15155 [Bordetella sp. SCN 68-11]